jgi:hypothetical protein
MTNSEIDNGSTRDDLVQRVALMETMIAEGRSTTTRFGWVFVMWGLVYFAAVGWVLFLPLAIWAWPVCVSAAIATSIIVGARRKRTHGGSENVRSRSIEAVWRMMGSAICLYVVGAIFSHHAGDPAYVAAILFFIGLAHGTSALILRWGVQGVVAAIWWTGGIATFFFTSERESYGIFLGASFFGMILFGLYAMMLERRRAAGPLQSQVQRHA